MKPDETPAPSEANWHPKIGDWFIMKASYCGHGNTNGCTEASPCKECMDICNRFIIAGEHYGTFFFNPQFCTRGSGNRLDETCCGVLYTGDTPPKLHPKEGDACHISETIKVEPRTPVQSGDKPACPKCGGAGWIFKGYGNDEQCDCLFVDPPEPPSAGEVPKAGQFMAPYDDLELYKAAQFVHEWFAKHGSEEWEFASIASRKLVSWFRERLQEQTRETIGLRKQLAAEQAKHQQEIAAFSLALERAKMSNGIVAGDRDAANQRVESLVLQNTSLVEAVKEAKVDKERLDWLETKTVNVRIPQVHGSLELFWSSPEDNDGDEQPSDIRQAIDAARALNAEGGR